MKWLKHPIFTALIGLALGMVIISVTSDCPEPPPAPAQEAFNKLAADSNARYNKLVGEYEVLRNEFIQAKASQDQQFTGLKGEYDQLKRDYSSLLAKNAEITAVYNPALVSEYSAMRARLTALQNLFYELEQENIRLKKELIDAERKADNIQY